MLSKCANPACSTPFRYLRDGKLFEIESGVGSENSTFGAKKPNRRVEFFWLCGQCSADFTVIKNNEEGAITISLRKVFSAKRAAAS